METVLSTEFNPASSESAQTDRDRADRHLIREIAAGNEDALRALYETYGARMVALALRITGDPFSAEEAVQESLVAAWQGARRYRGESRLIVWLLGIVHHKALNQVRGRMRSAQTALEEGPQEPPDSAPTPDEQAALSDRRSQVQAGLQTLSPEHRLTLELVFYQGLTLNEAAEVCGCPVGTVKSRLNSAKASLRGALHRAGFTSETLEP